MEHKIRSMAGGRPLVGKAILDKTQSFVLTPFNGQLLGHSLATRELIRTLKFDDDNEIDFAGLVAIKEDFENPHLIWAFKSDGEVSVINWKEKITNPIVKSFNIEVTNGSVLQIVEFEPEYVVLITGKESDKPHTRSLISYKYETGEVTELLTVKNVISVAISNNSNSLLFLSSASGDRNTLHVYDQETTQLTKISSKLQKHEITALAISNDGIAAVGTQRGLINVYQNNSSRTLKWHIDRVSSLGFTNDSSYLLSGGIEKVLVFWQLDTDKQQFLPRLNGEIIDINTNWSEHHNLTLKTDSQDNYEILILSAIDLQSRLLVSGPKQQLISDANNLGKLVKNFTKKKSDDSIKLRYDFTSIFKVHPISKNLYFLNGSTLQIFDVYKKEQLSVLKTSSSIPTGKVKSELKLQDPILKDFAFTEDGNWLVTLEEFHHGEVDDLLSKDDYTFTLKFWTLKQTQDSQQGKLNSANMEWELVSKIINPHGVGVPVLALRPAPTSYSKSHAILTADNHGGVRLWRSSSNTINKNVTWTLRKLKNSTGVDSNDVSLSWSEDGSLIFLGVDHNISVIDVETFEEVNNEFTESLSNIAGSTVKYLDVLDNHLVILSKSIFKTIDLLSLKETDLNLKLNTPNKGASQQISINHTSNLIAIVQNFYDSKSKSIKAKILIFNNKSKTPLFEATYPNYISSIKWNYENEFVFIDITAKVNLLSTTKVSSTATEYEAPVDHTHEIAQLLTAAEASNVIYKETIDIDNTDEINGSDKKLDINSFFNLFDNIEGDIKLETMFEKVMQVIN